MRIVAWNCQMGLDKKVDALLSLNPDYVVWQGKLEASALAHAAASHHQNWLSPVRLTFNALFSS